jgi:pimeloyl-ACP methyl ester carboxylesterase
MRLHVERRGTPGVEPIVFVHGLGSSSATWATCMDLLGTDHEVVAVDLLGHGASPVPDDANDYTRDGALADIDDVLASLSGPAVLVGHSLGGYLSLAHAATRPGMVRAIVVINTGPGFRDPDKREAWNERSRRNAHKFGVPPEATNLNLQADSVVMDHLAEMDVPTLVLAGELDRPEYVASGQYLERKMPHARLEVIAGGEHSMHESTHATNVADAIRAFLATLPPTP